MDSTGPATLWIMVAIAAVDAAVGAFLATNYFTGALVFNAHPDLKTQTPWVFVVAMTVAVASGAKALLRASDTMWRSWLFRIGLPVVLLAVIIFLVADAQAAAPEYIFFKDDGTLLRPAFPYVRAVFAAFSLVGQFALLVRLRGNAR
ncbi:hypothetical protein HMPREF9336_00462 [Segniliparus rugosus ATCC BAA-974]|uniref:Uncharacterized protein n=1 Tax=Segniliparus rugosus (strain ATCC BAA-974 / DSM 45345 / CCUG 50838 / CIP 108380 / JCM 13579 / CDC 945) TaxID=679197 RepID=E5XLU3_SEGRC|nr:hypothetical protein HMPREF9336_00462 [Segniliparus rugosus ATCC BAA-974]